MASSLSFGPASPAAVAVLAGSFLGGAMMSIFLLTIPVMLDTASTSTQLLKQWHTVYTRGHIQGPVISIVTGCIHTFAAWRSKEPAFAVAAGITVAMIPYTWIFMLGTNKGLFAALRWTDAEKEGGQEKVRGLVTSWSRLNAIRALFPLVGAAVGLVTLVGKTSTH